MQKIPLFSIPHLRSSVEFKITCRIQRSWSD